MLTPEHLAELRRALHYSGQPNFAVERDTIAALLDIADERDALVAAAERVRKVTAERTESPYAWESADGWSDGYDQAMEDVRHALDNACTVCGMVGQHKMSCHESGSGRLVLSAHRDEETGKFTLTSPVSETLDDGMVRGRYCDGVYMQTGHTTEGEDFDAWLAQHDAEVLNEASRRLERERDVPAHAWNFPRFGVSTNLAPGFAWREGMSTCVHWLRRWAEQQQEET